MVVGNEVLSAKVVDENGALLVRRLRERGVPLRSLSVVPDEVDAIVEAVALARRRARYVITSGGIGPTHDDVTVRAVALALGRPVVRLPKMEEMIRAHYGEAAIAAAMRLADAPEGTELLVREGIWYPVLCCDDVFMLPGVPFLFQAQLEVVLSRMEGVPAVCRCVYLSEGEAEIAAALDRVALSMPEVAIGSYPAVHRGAGFRVKLTVEHSSPERVEDAVARLRRELPEGSILKVE